MRVKVQKQRYWTRPTSYERVHYHSIINRMLSSRPQTFRYLFRMTNTEFARLVEKYMDDEVFEAKGNRPPADPKYQLAVFIYRLAHGHEMQTVQLLFGISSEYSLPYLKSPYLIYSVGTINNWTDNFIIAIIRGLKEEIRWPNPTEKAHIKRQIKAQFGIPHCLGFIDGTHINFEHKPSRGKPAGSWHSRKERYGMNVMAVVDDNKRFRYIHWGFSASASDICIQRNMSLTHSFYDYFDGEEHVLGDSGFALTPYILPMYKRIRGQNQLTGKAVSNRLMYTYLC
jgi:hypothetical protein